MLQTVVNLIEQEIELIESKHKLEILKIKEMYESLLDEKNKIIKSKDDELRNQVDRFKSIEEENNKTIEQLKSQRNLIRWDKTGEYYNLKDFCIASKYIFFFKENELKQYLLNMGVLEKENDKYVPNKKDNTAILIDNEIYIKYTYIRNHLILLRSLVFMGYGETLTNIVKDLKSSYDILTEKLGNTVYIECKQRSFEFRNCRENQNFIELNEATKRIE